MRLNSAQSPGPKEFKRELDHDLQSSKFVSSIHKVGEIQANTEIYSENEEK